METTILELLGKKVKNPLDLYKQFFFFNMIMGHCTDHSYKQSAAPRLNFL